MIKLTNRECIRMRGKKGKSQAHGNIGSRHHETSRDERKDKKRVPQKNKEDSRS